MAQLKLPGKPVEVERPGGDFSDEAYINQCVDAALHRVKSQLSDKVRQNYSGEFKIDKNKRFGTVYVSVTLKHHPTKKRITRKMRLEASIVETFDERRGRLRGKQLGLDLIHAIKEYERERKGNPNRQFYGDSIAKDLKKNRKLKPKARPKPKPCVLCGETDEKYPEWSYNCSHTPAQRKGK